MFFLKSHTHLKLKLKSIHFSFSLIVQLFGFKIYCGVIAEILLGLTV